MDFPIRRNRCVKTSDSPVNSGTSLTWVILAVMFRTVSAAVTGVSAGAAATCAVLDSYLYCWGDGSLGQSGNGFTTQVNQPPASPAFSGVDRLVPSFFAHGCLITQADSGVRCWGFNSNGQRGDGGAILSKGHPLFLGVASVAVGTVHTCVVVSGLVRCWGRNGFGELGDGTFTTPPDATFNYVVPTLPAVAALYAGASHTCAVIVSSKAVWCWGLNTNAQLGDGTRINRNSPKLIPDILVNAGPNAIAGGTAHTCAIHTDGSLFCWGDNTHGQLGTNDTTQRTVPTNITALCGLQFSAVTAGDGFTCGISGTALDLYCWGSNHRGQLGDGSTTARSTIGDPILTNVTVVSAGLGSHACAILKTDSSLRCWGENTRGQLGYGNTAHVLAPKAEAIVFPARPASRDTDQLDSSKVLSNGAVIGVVVGCSCAFVGVVVAVGMGLRSLRRKRLTGRVHSDPASLASTP